MNANHEELLGALREMWQRYPEWRLGQMICNVATWAKQPTETADAAETVWDLEDDELVRGIRQHLQNRARLEETASQSANESQP